MGVCVLFILNVPVARSTITCRVRADDSGPTTHTKAYKHLVSRQLCSNASAYIVPHSHSCVRIISSYTQKKSGPKPARL